MTNGAGSRSEKKRKSCSEQYVPRKDGMSFRLWTGESPRGIAIPFPRPMRKGREEMRPSARLAVMEESSQPKRIRVPPAAVPAAKDGPLLVKWRAITI